jgi:hypothetical protein
MATTVGFSGVMSTTRCFIWSCAEDCSSGGRKTCGAEVDEFLNTGRLRR